MNREPLPDWTRRGETWRVEPEDGGWVPTHGDGICNGTGCRREAVVFRPNRISRSEGFALCELHMRAAGMWIEGGQIVSWRLSK